jgi:hypothetical protein
MVDMLFFFGVLLVGFAYLWRFGYLDWVRSAATTSLKVDYPPASTCAWQNPHLNPPTLAGLKFHWTHAWQELYVPLTYTAWWLLATIAGVKNADGSVGLNPWIFHGANLLAHIISSLIVLRLLRRLLRDRSGWAACAGALLFAVHPVQVETVAWVSGLKDLLCGMFSLLAVYQYVSADRRPNHIAALLFFAAAILSKPTAVALPLILATIDLLLLNRPARDVLKSIIPFALLAVPCMIWTKHAQPSTLIATIPLWWRPFVAGDAIAYYLLKIVAPIHLAIDYGRTRRRASSTAASRSSPASFPLLLAYCSVAPARSLPKPPRSSPGAPSSLPRSSPCWAWCRSSSKPDQPWPTTICISRCWEYRSPSRWHCSG